MFDMQQIILFMIKIGHRQLADQRERLKKSIAGGVIIPRFMLVNTMDISI